MIGTYELMVIVVIALLFFGPDRIPELAHTLGKAVGEFKKAQMEVERETHSRSIQKEREERIKKVASEMGIDTKNKNIDELLDEMRSKNKTEHMEEKT